MISWPKMSFHSSSTLLLSWKKTTTERVIITSPFRLILIILCSFFVSLIQCATYYQRLSSAQLLLLFGLVCLESGYFNSIKSHQSSRALRFARLTWTRLCVPSAQNYSLWCSQQLGQLVFPLTPNIQLGQESFKKKLFKNSVKNRPKKSIK